MPNRLLRPAANKSKKLNAVSDAAQLLWYRLLPCLDDYGRFDADPALVAAATYPLRHNISLTKIAAQLRELSDIKLIILYTVNGDSYLQFTNWDPGNIRAKKSKYPEPCEHLLANDFKCLQTQTNVPDTDTDTDTDTDADGGKPPSLSSQIVDAYNTICRSLPRQSLTKSRGEKLKARIKEHPDFIWWQRLFQRVQTTPFCRGENDRKWKADLDWLIKNDTNALKVLEGKYDGGGGRAEPTREDDPDQDF